MVSSFDDLRLTYPLANETNEIPAGNQDCLEIVFPLSFRRFYDFLPVPQWLLSRLHFVYHSSKSRWI